MADRHDFESVCDEPTRLCIDCGYVLDGLLSDACPECGRAYDLDDHHSFCVWMPGSVDRRLHLTWFGVLFGYIAAMASLLIGSYITPLGAAIIALPFFWGVRVGRAYPRHAMIGSFIALLAAIACARWLMIYPIDEYRIIGPGLYGLTAPVLIGMITGGVRCSVAQRLREPWIKRTREAAERDRSGRDRKVTS